MLVASIFCDISAQREPQHGGAVGRQLHYRTIRGPRTILVSHDYVILVLRIGLVWNDYDRTAMGPPTSEERTIH